MSQGGFAKEVMGVSGGWGWRAPGRGPCHGHDRENEAFVPGGEARQLGSTASVPGQSSL